ncbi:uncharacterized protein LOC118645219 [Monomorium pharaonis]|uniref:uncharacterized protein LOC118645219 n=1 Tax=Monomorium pharaonis TaxID=307658 RepID=UPI0017478E23|nr:uncharacterized protein LOC118645219 [Monomorium pharaonis]
MAHSPAEASGNIPRNEVEAEILRLHNSLHEENDHAEERPAQRINPNLPIRESMLLHDVMHELRDLKFQLGLSRRDPGYQRRTEAPLRPQNFHDHALDLSYGRSNNDIRNQRGSTVNFLSMKEVRNMIPDIDGTQRNRVREFISAGTYAMKNIHPADEHILLEAILCTKFKGKAMMDFYTRDVYSFEQLKRELENEYLSKRSTAHLQQEFNSLKQKPAESAQEFGRRVDLLAMELYESMEEGKNHTIEQQRAILDNIKEQALYNYQIGLHEDIKLLVRAQRYRTLQDAISGASAEEKVREPNRNRKEDPRTVPKYARNILRCGKCGKNGHDGRECRSSRYANRFELPRPEGRPRVNTVELYCDHCKRAGHTRKECWSLHGQPKKKDNDRRSEKPKIMKRIENGKRASKEIKMIKHTETASSDESSSDDASSSRTADAYRVTHVKHARGSDTGLDMITLPVREAERGKIEFLFDTGSTVSLIKLKTLKGQTKIRDEHIKLTGITGHSIMTLGRTSVNVVMHDKKIKHPMYVIRDDAPIEYEGILGADFTRKNNVTCNYGTKTVRLGDTKFKLYPYRRVTLQPRSETIVQVTASVNTLEVINSEEMAPGVFLGSCLVEPENHTCPISIINTNDKKIDLQLPRVEIKKININNAPDTHTANVIRDAWKHEIPIPRAERIIKLLQLKHLNEEEKKAIQALCEEFSDVFYLEGDKLTYTTLVEHEIHTRTESASVNVRLYRLPEKQKTEVDKQIREMLEQGIICQSKSQWNAPLLVVPKKPDATGKPRFRVVVDFRKLNEITIGDSFPVPNITDILDQLGNAKYFTTLDLAAGYHQISVAEKDKGKTAFSTPYGHYEFNRMPFGLRNAPATFQRLINSVLTDLQGLKCLVYLDDIVIYGPEPERALQAASRCVNTAERQ